MTKGRLVILSGPSGVGKDTVIDAWMRVNNNVQRVVAYTTRMPRSGEQDGVDYRFVPEEVFDAMARDGKFLEYKVVHSNSYGTPESDVNAMLREGRIAVLKIDVQGALSVMEQRPDALSVFILPPDHGELARRIEARGADDPVAVTLRLRNAEAEIAKASSYTHQIVNDEVSEVVVQLQNLVNQGAS